LKVVLLGKPIERSKFRFLGNSNSSLTLHVGMSAHRENAGTRLAYIAAHQQKIAQHLNGEHAGSMLRQAHAVASDHRIRMGIHISCTLNRLAAETGTFFDLRPIEATNGLREFFISAHVFADEIDIENAFLLMRL